jgi:hypothetical protein
MRTHDGGWPRPVRNITAKGKHSPRTRIPVSSSSASRRVATAKQERCAPHCRPGNTGAAVLFNDGLLPEIDCGVEDLTARHGDIEHVPKDPSGVLGGVCIGIVGGYEHLLTRL